MSIFRMSEAVLDRDFHWLFDAVADTIDSIVAPLGVGEISLPAIPRRIGVFYVPYAFAGRIRLMLEYACGRQLLSREYILETESMLCQMLTTSVGSFISKPVDGVHEDDDVVDDDDDDDDDAHEDNTSEETLARYEDHPIVQVIYAARGRMALAARHYLTLYEFKALTGFNEERAVSVGIKVRKDRSGRPEFDYQGVQNILKNITSSMNEE